jgi:hypothetical protein
MRRNIGAIILAAIAFAACKGAAQTRSDTTAQTIPVAQITIIGCVQPADQSATDTVGPTGRTADTTYVLTHAKQGKNGSKESADATAKASTFQTASTYRLDAQDSTLSPNVGHQVEIVAFVEEPDSSTPGTTGSINSPAPKVKVDTVKLIAMTCPE